MTAVEKMERAIEEKRMTTGAMGTEATSVTIKATKEEVDEIIEAIEDNDHYNWEIEEDGITVTYTEGEDMKYFVESTNRNDLYLEQFDTLKEANQEAINEWEDTQRTNVEESIVVSEAVSEDEYFEKGSDYEVGYFNTEKQFFNLFTEEDIPAIVTETVGGSDEHETEIYFENEFVKGHFTIYYEEADLDETGQDFTDEAYLKFFEEGFESKQAKLSLEAK